MVAGSCRSCVFSRLFGRRCVAACFGGSRLYSVLPGRFCARELVVGGAVPLAVFSWGSLVKRGPVVFLARLEGAGAADREKKKKHFGALLHFLKQCFNTFAPKMHEMTEK